MQYLTRIKEALFTIKESYILIYHDNNILIADTDIDEFNKIEKILYRDSPDQLRLHPGSANVPGIHIEGDIYKMLPDDNYKYSVYPTIWKKTILVELYNNFSNVSYRDFENIVQPYMSKFINYYIWGL
jgi:hypothetical protein